jgi:uncharacterized protein YecT (DUF1311 family)
MTELKSKFTTIIFIFVCSSGFSQTTKTIEGLESQYQVCLDKGKSMLGCSEKFYFQMDSLLNVQYKKLRAKCDSIQKINLKDDQIKWLAVRDKQFKYNRQQAHKAAKESGDDGGQDETMILTDKNAMFVKDRVVELVNKLPDSYSTDTYKSKSYKVSVK